MLLKTEMMREQIQLDAEMAMMMSIWAPAPKKQPLDLGAEKRDKKKTSTINSIKMRRLMNW
jgi:hypothetical protein